MKRMLMNGTQSEERRLAVVDGQKLLDYEIELEGREQRKGNIYQAVVTRVEPSLEACFVDYGEDRHGFLPFKEISKQYFPAGTSPAQARINEVISEGQELLVQVDKEERGNKGAALTTFISLAGRYVVLMPNNPRGGGVSRRIEGEERAELKEALDQLNYPNGMSIIARTAGIGRSAQELQWDLDYLLKLWQAIDGAAQGKSGAFLIHQESNLVVRALRDYFSPEIGDILIDADDLYEQAYQFMRYVMPEHAEKVKRYRDDTPLFSRFQIEHQIESAYAREVALPSGGSIVIDHTEALVSVDVNSARAIKGSHIEETATRTNLEAAEEVARQMRLRDLGGLVVIDFIDMDEQRNRREVENRLRESLRQDRARVQFASISRFGLMEMSRQRLRPALSEGASIPCPRCGGSGHVRDTESSALQILRIIQQESMKDNTAAVHAQVPVEVASFLLNEKRPDIAKIELKQRSQVVLIPNRNLETPNYRLERIKPEDPRLDDMAASYLLAEEIEQETITLRSKEPTNKQAPLIKGILPDAPPAPTPSAPAAPSAATAELGFFASIKRWWASLTEGEAPAEEAAPVEKKRNSRNAKRNNRGDRRSRKPRNERNHDRNERTDSTADHNERSNKPTRNKDVREDKRDDRRDDKQRRRKRTDTVNETKHHAVDANAPETAQKPPVKHHTDAPAPAIAAPIEANAHDSQTDTDAPQERRERRSRDRYGRDRRRARNRNEAQNADVETENHTEEITQATNSNAEPAPVTNIDADAGPTVAIPRSYFSANANAPRLDLQADADAATSHTPSAPQQVESTTTVETTQTSEQPPLTPPVKTEPQATAIAEAHHTEPSTATAAGSTANALPSIGNYQLPQAQLQQVADQAGLQWVNSDADKVAAVQAAIAAEPKPEFTPRQRPAPVVLDDAPLILVETRRDLTQVPLPFEEHEPQA